MRCDFYLKLKTTGTFTALVKAKGDCLETVCLGTRMPQPQANTCLVLCRMICCHDEFKFFVQTAYTKATHY